ncbi:SDR family oxidoreductase [Thalassospira marina]|uniref:Oxidoreductase n=1 Tax=Thalassospira marina TaxID=2048283 RepID=A0A2N3KRI2_9PROT|nr:SDR family oxidoreductase [Thalassospira marina]PKR53162.1 oxidoreductase [Thalassospira marina]
MTAGIDGKVIVLTGASSGIGAATARLLAAKGARLMIGARGQERLSHIQNEITAAGGICQSQIVDVSDAASVSALVAAALSAYGRVDVLINNAGVMPISMLDQLRVAEWDAMVDINLKGVLYGVAAVLPIFRAQKSGHIITTASTAAHKTVAGQSVYSATKFAVRAFCEGLRQEAGRDFRVTVISPGMTQTAFASHITDPAMRERLEKAGTDIAISPDALARAMAFAIKQPDDVDVGEIIVRPTAQP